MRQTIGLVALLVHDYDAALAFFAGQLGFAVIEDRLLPDGKRWVVVRPPGASETGLLLARAADTAQRRVVGAQGGGRVAFFLETDDFARDHAAFTERGVRFLEQRRHEAYGTVAVFEDCCGNTWDLIERGRPTLP